MLHGGHAETERMFYSQESGRQSILDDASAQLTVLAPTNAGLAIEQLGDLQDVRLHPSCRPLRLLTQNHSAAPISSSHSLVFRALPSCQNVNTGGVEPSISSCGKQKAFLR